MLFAHRLLFVLLLIAPLECKDDGFDYDTDDNAVLTKAEIKALKGFVKETMGGKPRYLTRYKGQIYFNAESKEQGHELFVTDGKNQISTRLFLDLNPGKRSSWRVAFVQQSCLRCFAYHRERGFIPAHAPGI